MRITKALFTLKMARSMGEGFRLVKQGAVHVGGCIPPCNMRMPPFRCSCGGWRKVVSYIDDIPAGELVRVGKMGNWRLLAREDGRQGFDQLRGIGIVPEEEIPDATVEPKDEPCQDSPGAV